MFAHIAENVLNLINQMHTKRTVIFSLYQTFRKTHKNETNYNNNNQPFLCACHRGARKFIYTYIHVSFKVNVFVATLSFSPVHRINKNGSYLL